MHAKGAEEEGGVSLRAPFPWFGGKSRVADVVWRAFGDTANYVEPFAGSLAVLLARPTPARIETVNDRDCHLANFWRACQSAPDEVARHCDWPVNEADLESRHRWLVNQVEFRERMKADPEYFDAKIAGWWVWGLCSWIGSGWCLEKDRAPADSAPGQRGEGRAPEDDDRGAIGTAGQGVHRQIPHLGTAGQGVHRKIPHLGDAGQGVHRQIPHLGDAGRGVHRKIPHLGDAGRLDALAGVFGELAARLRRVRVCCGDWTRCLGDSVTWRHGTTAVFLDPPYDDGAIDYAAGGRGVAAEVAQWCREHGDDKRLRIALCGYEGDHAMPATWAVHAWKAHGGFGSQRSGDPNGNPHRERVWFSPGCLPVVAAQGSLFGGTP